MEYILIQIPEIEKKVIFRAEVTSYEHEYDYGNRIEYNTSYPVDNLDFDRENFTSKDIEIIEVFLKDYRDEIEEELINQIK